jgi:hypothetical protein
MARETTTRTRYIIPAGRLRWPGGTIGDHVPAHPERASVRHYRNPSDPIAGDFEIRIWPSRGAMLEAVRMASCGPNRDGLRPYIKELAA